jgi:pyruvate formate lyase activating enzyme
MRIAAIQKNSFIDYPDHLSCVLFLRGCNFTCPYCHNPDLVRSGGAETGVSDIPIGDVLAFLEKRRGMLEGVVLTGGEPTLRPDLPELCRRIRNLGYPVKLDTNGSRPEMLASLIREGRVDYLAMDVKTAPARYAPLIWPGADPEAIRESIRLVRNAGLPHEFRTTCVAPPVDAAAVAVIADLIAGADRYALQRLGDAAVLQPAFFGESGGRAATPEEMERFRTLAAPRVGRCEIR